MKWKKHLTFGCFLGSCFANENCYDLNEQLQMEMKLMLLFFLTIIASFLLVALPHLFSKLTRWKLWMRVSSVLLLTLYLIHLNGLFTSSPAPASTAPTMQSTVTTQTITKAKNTAPASAATPSESETNVTSTVTQDDFKKLFLTKSNHQVIAFLTSLLLAWIGVLIFSLPFMDFTEFSILGNTLKVKEQAAKSEAAAAAELDNLLKLEHQRSAILLAISTPALFQIETCFDAGGHFQPALALQKVANTLTQGFLQTKKTISLIFVEIQNGQAVDLEPQLEGLDLSNRKLIRKTATDALTKGDSEVGNQSGRSVLATPLSTQTGQSAFSQLLILYSTDMEFSEIDAMMVHTAWQMIEHQRLIHTATLQATWYNVKKEGAE
ncbi:hypothetical protein OS242_06640 [Tumebacillus sp. DT12]|uniref:GAF domain-containing protein n=1 Tax=Tumebacillus lacus TaxID=2995335 RepID=A0ABT3WZJ7_9BACL|nr:hypothetical protein [Tumebacillus lacus]MCX7569636.1 hypothetical protein [Tumebacillus lacus]